MEGKKNTKPSNPHPFSWLSITTTSLERKVEGDEFCNIIHFTSRRGSFGLWRGILLPDVWKKFNHFKDVLQGVWKGEFWLGRNLLILSVLLCIQFVPWQRIWNSWTVMRTPCLSYGRTRRVRMSGMFSWPQTAALWLPSQEVILKIRKKTITPYQVLVSLGSPEVSQLLRSGRHLPIACPFLGTRSKVFVPFPISRILGGGD